MLFWFARRTVRMCTPRRRYRRRSDAGGCLAVLVAVAGLAVLGLIVKIARAVAESGWGSLIILGCVIGALVGLGVLGAMMSPPPRPPLPPPRPPVPPSQPRPPLPPNRERPSDRPYPWRPWR